MSNRISNNAFWIVLSAILAGLFIPQISSTLRPYTFEFLFLVMLCTLLRMPTSSTKEQKSIRKIKMGKLLVWQLIITPTFVWGIVTIAQLPQGIATAIIACACAGPVFSTPAFAKLNALDEGFTIQNLVQSSLLMPIILLVAGFTLLPNQLDVDFLIFVERVAIFLLTPFAVGFIFKKTASRAFQNQADMPLLATSTLALAFMACSLMDGMLARMISDPSEMAGLLGLVLTFNLGLQFVTTIAFKSMGLATALNAGLVCGYRNWALTLAITAGSLGEDFTAFVAIGQFGVMLLPLPSLKYLKAYFKD